MTKNKTESLYIHIPFCNHICHYCDFSKVEYNQKYERPYLERLKKELLSYDIKDMKTIYIGGGTPSSLSLEGLEILLEILKPYSKKVVEYTFEANPESLDEEKIILLSKYGVNRVSLGVESTIRSTLNYLGRHHTFDDVKNLMELLRKHSINDINLDLIIALPDQKNVDILFDLNNLVCLKPTHISVYTLTVNEHTMFHINGIKEESEERSREECDLVHNFLSKYGFNHYEISNYSIKGKEGKHNKTYWRNERYYGCGLGASGYLENVRYTNTKSLNDYLSKDDIIAEKETVSEKDDVNYFVMLNLRLKEGFKDEDFIKRYGYSFLEAYKDFVKAECKRGLLEVKEDIIRPTYEGMMLLDLMLKEFNA